ELVVLLHLLSGDGGEVKKVMVAPILPFAAEENLRDPIDIRVDIIHLEPVAVIPFPAAAVGELTAPRFRVYVAEAENASLRAMIKTTEAIEKITRSQDRRARMKMKRQLASERESQRHDQENFRKLQELVTTQLERHP
nr:hypothetical protein [Tanacetum cinerariifolium]